VVRDEGPASHHTSPIHRWIQGAPRPSLVRHLCPRSLGSIALLLWPFVVIWPGSWRRRYGAARFGATCIQRLTGAPFKAVGAMLGTRPLVVVANHESFVDGAVLLLALDEPIRHRGGCRSRTSGSFDAIRPTFPCRQIALSMRRARFAHRPHRWALEDSNLRPQPCEGCALTN
jgi:hypothetical protein